MRVFTVVGKFVEPGTVIISDKFSPYFNLNDVGHINLMVTHSENFIDSNTKAHSSTTEGLWTNASTKAKLPGYL